MFSTTAFTCQGNSWVETLYINGHGVWLNVVKQRKRFIIWVCSLIINLFHWKTFIIKFFFLLW